VFNKRVHLLVERILRIIQLLNHVNRFVDIESRLFGAVDLTLHSTIITTFTACFTIQTFRICLHNVFVCFL